MLAPSMEIVKASEKDIDVILSLNQLLHVEAAEFKGNTYEFVKQEVANGNIRRVPDRPENAGNFLRQEIRFADGLLMIMNIRNAIGRDATGIVRVGCASFTRAFGHLFTPEVLARYLDDSYSVEKISASQTQPDNVYFIVESQGDVVGFLKLKRNCSHHLIESDRQLKLQKICVRPEAVDGGIGTGLMRIGEKVILAESPDCVWLMVYEGNTRAVSFYERFGYLSIGADHHDFERSNKQSKDPGRILSHLESAFVIFHHGKIAQTHAVNLPWGSPRTLTSNCHARNGISWNAEVFSVAPSDFEKKPAMSQRLNMEITKEVR